VEKRVMVEWPPRLATACAVCPAASEALRAE
jgi:hypothetical protein